MITVGYNPPRPSGVGFSRGAKQLRAITAYATGLEAAYRHTDYLALAAGLRRTEAETKTPTARDPLAF